MLGVLANHKGAHLVASVAMAADPARLEIQVIGDMDANFPAAARERMTIHGRYQEGELPALLANYRPHVIWFPAPWPETYSFTLSAAIDAGLPIVASEIGAFPERLAGRPLTWLIPPTLDPAAWLTLFESVAVTIRAANPGCAQTSRSERSGGSDPQRLAPARVDRSAPQRHDGGTGHS